RSTIATPASPARSSPERHVGRSAIPARTTTGCRLPCPATTEFPRASRARSMRFHMREQRGGRPAVELQSAALLILAKRGAGLHSGFAVDLVVIEAAGGEDLLHAVEIAGRQLRDLAPRRLERPRIGHAIAEMTDEQHVEVG